MKDFFKDIVKFATTRKFWTAVAGAVVAYLTIKLGTTPELTLFTGLLTAIGVYGVGNEE